MINEIKSWLNNGQNYAAGAALYLKYGDDKMLKKVFSEPVSDFKRKKLAEVMKALAAKKKTIANKVEESKQEQLERYSAPEKKWPNEGDEVLIALRTKWKPLFAEMMNLCSRLYDVARAGETDPAMERKAGEMAHRILDLDDECDAIYEQRDHYLKHGNLPGEKGLMELVTDVKKIPLALQNAKRYVRDYRNTLKKNPDNVDAAKQLQRYEWAIVEYKKMLCLE